MYVLLKRNKNPQNICKFVLSGFMFTQGLLTHIYTVLWLYKEIVEVYRMIEGGLKQPIGVSFKVQFLIYMTKNIPMMNILNMKN